MNTYFFPRKVQYEREGEYGTTKCPFGGAFQGRDYLFKKDVHWPGAMVGGLACSDCKFNRGTEYTYVLCNRKF